MSVTSEQGIESVVIFFEDCSVFLLWKFGKMNISGIVGSRKNFRSKHMKKQNGDLFLITQDWILFIIMEGFTWIQM